MKAFLLRFTLLLAVAVAPAAVAADLSFSIGAIAGAGFAARDLTLHWGERGMDGEVGEIRIFGRTWRNVRFVCPVFHADLAAISCDRGELQAADKLPLSFTYWAARHRLEAQLFPASGETWRIGASQADNAWEAKVDLANANPARLAGWFPADWPRPTGGRLEGTLSFSSSGLTGDLRLRALAFSDAAGLRAGDKLSGRLLVSAVPRGGEWRWTADVGWREGAVFWRPFYFPSGGQRFVGQGSIGPDGLSVTHGKLELAGVGSARVAGRWHKGALTDFELAAAGLDLDGLYRLILKPWLEKGALANLDVRGSGDLRWRYRDEATRVFDVALRETSLKDRDRRFAIDGVNLRLPWEEGQENEGKLAFGGGHFFDIPFGAIQVLVKMKGWQVALPDLSLPVLDGRLTVNGFQAERRGGMWNWCFGGGVTPISMERLSAVLGWPKMFGSLSGVLPAAIYDGHQVRVDGVLLVRAFDGTAVVKNLSLVEPLGRAPRLYADLDMRGLDLDLLTRTFSFGSITGRVDATVSGLELSNWQPVKFDARVASSPGDYPRQISQRAVQNISSLGGAGAGAAIQRSFLRFLDQFGYSRIGLSCVLRNGVCTMDGVEAAPHGYVIVKGGGIPAITVIGYNHYVGWDELLGRLERVIQGNVKPIVE
jgi:hypothetical protein